MNVIPSSSKEPKGDNATFLQDAERNAAFFGKFKPKYFIYIGPGSASNPEKMYPFPDRGIEEMR